MCPVQHDCVYLICFRAFKICAIVSTVIGVILLAIYFIFCTISFICYCGYEVQEDKKLNTLYAAWCRRKPSLFPAKRTIFYPTSVTKKIKQPKVFKLYSTCNILQSISQHCRQPMPNNFLIKMLISEIATNCLLVITPRLPIKLIRFLPVSVQWNA